LGPDHERLEATSGADGLVVFDGIDLDQVTTALATKEGHDFLVATGNAIRAWKYGVPKIVWLNLLGNEFPKNLSGTIENATGDVVSLRGTPFDIKLGVPNVWEGAPTETWSVAALPGQPFSLFALDISIPTRPPGWWWYLELDHVFRADLPEPPRTYVIDFATPQPALATASGRFRMPDHPKLGQQADGAGVEVWSYGVYREAILGLGTHTKRSDDGLHADYEASWFDARDLDLVTVYSSLKNGALGTPEWHTFVIADGTPPNGDVDPGFLSPPEPVLLGTAHGMMEPLRWHEDGELPELVHLRIFDADGNRVGRFTASGDEGDAGMDFHLVYATAAPELAAILASGALGGFLFSCTTREPAQYCAKQASGPRFQLLP